MAAPDPFDEDVLQQRAAAGHEHLMKLVTDGVSPHK